MEVIKYDDSFHLDITNSIISIGNYDGVHLGHQHILKELVHKSKERSSKSFVATFEPHPKKFFSRDDRPFLLSSFDEKVDIISAFDVDYLVCFEFNENFASITASDFVTKILVDKLDVSEVIVGYNFNFGKGREGNVDFLKEMGTAHGFDVTIVEPKKVGGERISSSHIRELITSGDVKKAAGFLGRNYFLTGKVIRGKDVGKKIGFPTVNLSVTGNKLLPSDGVYSVLINFAGKSLHGVANLGYQPTFGENKHSIEAHIFDFHEEIYDKDVTLLFIEKIRDEKKFEGTEDLTDQIKKDVESAKASLTGM